ncbi:ROK family protein [Butyrivibrio sp. YAB3001]|uniref:ROK family protein n=1 Tax=Butyrivibrio sp. YAB3001 TaxID=1520812 RepID=UPI0008F62A1F|nr:ROK family protein [Butyrivibrio sp. YAB3001]SFC37090.1 fructokinase [Butyrivibrio sp. YAB3001]
MLYGALEAGGTKMVCAIGDENGKIFEQVSIPTTMPDETMPRIIEYFKDKDIKAIGIACFGPIDLNKESDTYGYITSTPKTAWKNFNIVGCIKDALGIPVGFDTDVNGSLLGEITWGCAKGLTDAIYLTIGTGVGGGVMSNGRLLHGMLHPELGHIMISKRTEDKGKCVCPFHQNCFEGLASGPSIEVRWGQKAVELADKEEVWKLEADYIGEALVNFCMTLSPQKIILGGGVMHQEQLFVLIREYFKKYMNGYIQTKNLKNLDEYIVPASLNDDQGIMGAIKLAMDSVQ